MERLLAPIGDERARQPLPERDLQLVNGAGAHGDLDEVDALDGPPADQPEPLDENAVLVGTDDRPPLEQRHIVVGDARRGDAEHQPQGAPGDDGRRKHRRRKKRDHIDRDLNFLTSVGDGVAADIALVHVRPL